MDKWKDEDPKSTNNVAIIHQQISPDHDDPDQDVEMDNDVEEHDEVL